MIASLSIRLLPVFILPSVLASRLLPRPDLLLPSLNTSRVNSGLLVDTSNAEIMKKPLMESTASSTLELDYPKLYDLSKCTKCIEQSYKKYLRKKLKSWTFDSLKDEVKSMYKILGTKYMNMAHMIEECLLIPPATESGLEKQREKTTSEPNVVEAPQIAPGGVECVNGVCTRKKPIESGQTTALSIVSEKRPSIADLREQARKEMEAQMMSDSRSRLKRDLSEDSTLPDVLTFVFQTLEICENQKGITEVPTMKTLPPSTSTVRRAGQTEKHEHQTTEKKTGGQRNPILINVGSRNPSWLRNNSVFLKTDTTDMTPPNIEEKGSTQPRKVTRSRKEDLDLDQTTPTVVTDNGESPTSKVSGLVSSEEETRSENSSNTESESFTMTTGSKIGLDLDQTTPTTVSDDDGESEISTASGLFSSVEETRSDRLRSSTKLESMTTQQSDINNIGGTEGGLAQKAVKNVSCRIGDTHCLQLMVILSIFIINLLKIT